MIWLRRPLVLFFVAAALRIVVLTVLVAHSPAWWGVNEAGNIGRGLVLGRGFGSPFHDANGPTAWLAPIYPSLLACIFFLSGIQTAASAWVAALLNVVFSSLTALVVRQLGREHFGETAGIVAGWAWALSPPVVIMPWLLWETCLSALVMSFVFLRTLRLNESSRLREWAGCGAIWSFAALLNPALLAPLPVLAIRAAWRGCGKRAAVMVGVCALGIMPWTARNLLSLHHLVPVRSNFWPEAYFGNVSFSLHPTGESMVYQQEGEIAFAADLRARTIEHVRSHTSDFARLTLHRVIAFWTAPLRFETYAASISVAAWCGVFLAAIAHREWFPFACALALYPLIYYVTFTFARYRHPIEPFVYVLAAYAGCELAAYGKRWGAARGFE